MNLELLLNRKKNQKQKTIKMAKCCYKRFSAFLLLIVLVLLLNGCASRPVQEDLPAEQILSWFMEDDLYSVDSNVYVIIPIERNEPFFMDVASRYVEADTLESFVSRTTTVYASLSPVNREVSFAAHGAFPKRFSSLIFPKSKGWQKQSFDSSIIIPDSYTNYYKADAGIGTIQAAIPTSNLLLASFNKIETILERAGSGYVGTAFDESILTVLNGDSDSIRFYVPNAQEYIKRILGDVMTLPVESAVGSLLPKFNEDDTLSAYTATIHVEIINPRLVATTAMLLNSLFYGTGEDFSIRAEGSYIVIENMQMSLENITQLL